uniref:RING-type domain-containing protein n=1 Tax=Anopheles stephensi TaxID=30069 RepID=A0A182Y3B9_ANOST
MVLAAIGDFIYNFYCLVHQLVTIVSYAGYILYYIIHNVAWIVLWCLQNVTAFTQIVYEDNRHLIQDAQAFLAGTSQFFITNIGKVASAVLFVGRAIYNGTIAFLSVLKLSVWGVKQALILTGDAVWMLFTAPYQVMVLIDAKLGDGWELLQQAARNLGDALVAALLTVKQFICQEVPAQSAWGLLLLALLYQYPKPMVVTLNYFKQMVHSGYCFVRPKLQRTYSLTVNYLWNVYRMRNRNATGSVRRPDRAEEDCNRSTVGNCIICEDNERTVAFIPCGHLCVCKACARELCYYNPLCPLCRKFIERKLEVYL